MTRFLPDQRTLISFVFPNPDKLSRSQRSADPARGVVAKRKSRFIGELKIYGFARAAQALAPRVALSFLFKSIVRPRGSRRVELLKYSIWLCHKSCANMM